MTIIFIHGAGGNGGLWLRQTGYFKDSDAVTLPGHPEGASLPGIDEYREWLRAHIAARGYQDVVLAGHSMGGAIALSYALAYPEDISGMVLLSAGARLRVNPAFLKTLSENTNRPPSWYREVARPLFSKIEPALREIMLDRLCVTPVEVHLNDFLACDRFDIMNAVGNIRVPALLICGDRDVMTPVKYSKYLADRIPGSRLVVVPGAGHMVYAEHPDAVNGEIEEFVHGLQNTGGSGNT